MVSKLNQPNKPCLQDKYYDYIIVGNGTAGAVLARKLSDSYQNRVLCIEVGRNRTDDPIVKSTDVFNPEVLNDLTFNPKYSVAYSVATWPATSPLEVPDYFPPLGQAISYTEGRMWGGSSAHNYLQAARGTPSIYDEWAAISGNNQWLYNNLLPTMKRVETYTPYMLNTPIDTSQRGTRGPIYFTQQAPVTSDPIAIGVSAGTNTPFVNDYNNIVEGALGVSSYQVFATPGANSERSYSQPGYLLVGEIIDADGVGLNGRPLRVISACFVTRVLFDGNRAVGVEYIENYGTVNSRVVQVHAMKKVILSAGAINSPAILQRSGIGDAALLNSLGIPVLVNNPNVGKNLVNQYGPLGVLVNVPLNVPSNEIAFINASGVTPSFPDDEVRRLQVGTQFFGPGRFGMYGFILQSESKGSVEIVDTNPLIQPKVDLNMFASDFDANLAIVFYKLLLKISANIPGSIIVYPTPSDYLSDDSLLTAAKNISTTLVEFHIASTTKMGRSIADGVVDGNLHVFGTSNLMVVDLGSAPVIPDGNTAFCVYVMAEIAADIILKKKYCMPNLCKCKY